MTFHCRTPSGHKESNQAAQGRNPLIYGAPEENSNSDPQIRSLVLCSPPFRQLRMLCDRFKWRWRVDAGILLVGCLDHPMLERARTEQ